METENAKVKSFFIGLEDHGIPAWALTFSGPNWEQSTGARGFGTSFSDTMRDLCRVLDVTDMQKVAGKPCRVRCDKGIIKEIGHFLEDKWVLL